MQKDSLRIVHCLRSPTGGAFRHVRDLVRAQHAAGHRVALVCEDCVDSAHDHKQFADITPLLTLSLHRIPMKRQIGLGDIAAAWHTYRIFKKIKPDIIHGHGAKGGAYTRLLGSLVSNGLRRPARFYTPHGGSLHHDTAKLSSKVMFIAERMQERLTDGLIFVSNYELDIYRQKIGTPRCPTHIIYNGLNEDEFEPIVPSHHAADFLYIGMMRDLKGPDLFIKALAILSKSSALKPTAIMVGEGSEKARYQNMVEALSLGEQVHFQNSMPIRKALLLGKTVVIPSRAEALPYVLVESLAAERPVIATRVGGIAEVLGNDSTALAEVSAEALAAKMHLALTQPMEFAAEMPNPAKVYKQFNLQQMTMKLDAIYRDAV